MSPPRITKGTNSTMNHSRTRRLPALTLAVAVTALSVAACGSSSNTSSASASNPSSSSSGSASAAAGGSGANRATLAACLKSHGVTLPARRAGAPAGGTPPGGYGGGGGRPGLFGGGGAGGRFANNPKLRAAFQACGGGRGFGGRRLAPSHAAVTTFVACVKQHGYNLPAPNFSGAGPVFPAGIQTNKQFQAASKPCASDLRPAGAPPGGAGGPANGAPPSA